MCVYIYLSIYIHIYTCVYNYTWISILITVNRKKQEEFLSLGLVSDCLLVYNIFHISFDLLRQEDKDYVLIFIFLFLLLPSSPLHYFFFTANTEGLREEWQDSKREDLQKFLWLALFLLPLSLCELITASAVQDLRTQQQTQRVPRRSALIQP